MEKNAKFDNVTPTVTLVDKEGYAVGYDGLLVSVRSQMCLGVVKMGRPANYTSVIQTQGQCSAYVDAGAGAGGAIAQYDPLTPNGTYSGTGTASIDGILAKATVGTHHVRAVALEAKASGTGAIEVCLLGS